MEPQIAANSWNPAYQTGQTRPSTGLQERIQTPEQLPSAGEMTSAQIQEHQTYLNRTQENIDRLRYPESLPSLEGAVLPAHTALPDQASLPVESRRIKEAYDKENRDLDEIRACAMDTAQRQGTGTTNLGGMKVTVTREQSRVKVVMDSSSLTYSPSVITEEYDERDPAFVRYSLTDGHGTTGSERKGSMIGRLERSGDRVTYMRTEEALLQYTNRKDKKKKKITIRNDGSMETVNSQADGKIATKEGSRKTAAPEKTKGTTVADAGSMPDREYLQDFVKRHSYQLNAEGAKIPLSSELLDRYVEGLQGFDMGTLKNLEKEGLSFISVNAKKTPEGGFPGNLKEWPKDAAGKGPSAGYYCSYTKEIVLDENFHIPDVTHEVGHAIDDMLARDKSRKPQGTKFQSDKDSAVKKLYADYQKRTARGERAWSDYAKTNIREYVAAAVEYHNTPAISGILKENDPGMYAYVEELLNKSGQVTDKK